MLQETTSHDVEVLTGLLRKLAGEKAYWQAQVIAKHLVELVPDDPEIWYLYGHSTARLGDHAAAVGYLAKALNLAGPGIEIAIEMCYIDGVRGDLKGAIEWCRRGLELEPANPALHRELARLYARSGDPEQAVQVLEVFLRMPALEPDDEKAVRGELGHLCMRMRRFDDALVHFRIVAGADETDDSAWANIGHCLSRKGEKKEALEAFEHAVKILPDAKNLYNLGDAYLALGQPDKAVGPLRDAVRNNPDHALAHYDLGLAYFELGRFTEADAEAQAALKADPDMMTAEMNLGISATGNLGLSLMSQEKYEEAILCFKRNEKQFAATYFNMGLALFRAKRYREALDYFKRATEIEPDDAEYLDLLGQTHDVLGNYGVAEKHLRRSLEIAPKYAFSYYDLGNLFLKIKDKRKEAKKLLERAIELNPKMMWAYYCLGCWYALEGQKTKAFEYLDKAFEKGFKDREWIEGDKDLEGLRGDARYGKMMAKPFEAGSGGGVAVPKQEKIKRGKK